MLRIAAPPRLSQSCKSALAALLLIILIGAVSAAGQGQPPRIIDCHIHYNGDPAFIQKLLDTLESVNGIAFLIVTPPSSTPPSRFSSSTPTGWSD